MIRIVARSATLVVVSCWLSLLIPGGVWISESFAWNALQPRRQQYRRSGPFFLHSSAVEVRDIEVLHGAWNSSHFGATKCWGRQPLLLKGAFPVSDSEEESSGSALPSWHEIIELACCAANEDDREMAESLACRLIQHKPEHLGSFTVEFGPFEDIKELDSLLRCNDNESASTLVLNDVDRWIPDLSDWMDSQFDFLPRWRRDDAQVSLAATGGGIGAHVDNYDVFLIQTSGRRDWEVGLGPITVQQEFDNLVEPSQVRILDLTDIATSINTVKLQLQPGDCLYLPPRFIHRGTATSDDCVTLSVGCRAPSAADLLSKLAESVATSPMESAVRRYSDLDLMDSSSSQSVSNEVKDKMKEILLGLVNDFVSDDPSWDSLVGKLITEPNRPVLDYPTPLYEMDSDWKQELGVWGDSKTALEAVQLGDGVLRRAEGVAFAWSVPVRSGDLVGNLYAQGQVFHLRREESLLLTEEVLDRIANGPPVDCKWLKETMPVGQKSPATKKFLLELLEAGFLYGDDIPEN
jgi:50S ribosomal protein L16 3-hydroxylase